MTREELIEEAFKAMENSYLHIPISMLEQLF